MTDTHISTRCRAVEDNARAALEAAGEDPHQVDQLPSPIALSDLCEIADRAGVNAADLLAV